MSQMNFPESYKTFSMYMSESKVAALKHLAKKDKRSLSGYIDILIENHLKELKKGKQLEIL